MSFGFVTGGQMANFTSLAARVTVSCANAGWDVEANGLFGAPPVHVIVSEESHYTIFLALRLLGLGAGRVDKIPTDEPGPHARRRLLAILRAQRRTLRSSAPRPATSTPAPSTLCPPLPTHDANRRLAPRRQRLRPLGRRLARTCPLAHGIERADSVATDAHKWLNVPYDCGIVFCADEAAHRTAMSLAAAYIVATRTERDPHEFVPEESRRARAIPVYAALRSLGRRGLGEMIERNCRQARASPKLFAPPDSKSSTTSSSTRFWSRSARPSRPTPPSPPFSRTAPAGAGGTVWQRPHRHAHQRQQLVHHR